MKNINKTFNQLPPWAKGTIAIGALAVVGYVAYKVIQMPKNWQQNKPAREQESAELSEQNQLIAHGKKPTLTKTQMTTIANSIFVAMDGYGTDESKIVEQFKKIKNDLDYLGVSLTYGIREVSSGKWNPEPNYSGNMSGALHSELSSYWIKEINAILQKNGVKYRV